MKLRSYDQGGGLIYTPFIGERNIAPTTSKASSSSDDFDSVDKTLVSLLKDQNLLPSDIDYITKEIIKFQQSSSSLYDPVGLQSSTVSPNLIKIMNSVSKAKFNKEQNDNAVKQMMSEGAGNELAMDSYGHVYVQDADGNIKKITSQELYSDSENFIPLSNSQLINYRQRVLGMDASILNDMQNIVGKQSIAKELDRIISQYGTTENVMMLSKDTAVQNALLDLNAPDGIYKVTEKYQVKDIEKAAAALYRRLPKNMQDAMKADAAYNGLDPDKEVWRMVVDTIQRNTDNSLKIDYDSTASKAAGIGGGSESSKTVKDTYPERLVSDPLTPIRYTHIQSGNSGTALYAYAQDAGPILEKDEKTMYGNAPLSKVFENTAVGTVVDRNSIMFGGRFLLPGDLSKVVYDNSVNMQRVWMPIHVTSDGRVMPDLGAMEKVDSISKELENTYSHDGVVNEAAINEWLQQNGIQAHWDKKSGSIVFDESVMRPFLVIKGVATEESAPENKKWLHDAELNPDEKESTWNLYNNATGLGYWTWLHELWTGNVYMPLKSSELATFMFNAEIYPQETYMNIAGKTQQRNREAAAQAGMITNFK